MIVQLQVNLKNCGCIISYKALLASISLLVMVLVLGRDKMVVVSAMGATAFIIFAMSAAASTQTRNVI